MKKTVIAFILIVCINILFAQNKARVSSPDKQLNFTFSLAYGHPQYSVKYKNKILAAHSTLGLTFIGNDFFGNNIETKHVTVTNGTEDYTLP
ncbi:MAG: glycoside hydrolase family 97 N-terminal domain-containing protein, partial [Ginsengibacter sp.]